MGIIVCLIVFGIMIWIGITLHKWDEEIQEKQEEKNELDQEK